MNHSNYEDFLKTIFKRDGYHVIILVIRNLRTCIVISAKNSLSASGSRPFYTHTSCSFKLLTGSRQTLSSKQIHWRLASSSIFFFQTAGLPHPPALTSLSHGNLSLVHRPGHCKSSVRSVSVWTRSSALLTHGKQILYRGPVSFIPSEISKG